MTDARVMDVEIHEDRHSENMMINMGPQHPSTHGVLRLVLELDGEEILLREPVGDRSLVLFDSGDEVTVQAGENGIRFLLVSGKPIQEPVAWYGPIVMNTQAELNQAVSELRNGTFIKGD